MSPEQARGEKVDYRTDLWSLGVVLYEALTGKVPFTAPNTLALLLAIDSREPVPLRELRPEVPPALEEIVGKLLRKRPEERYESSHELLADLEQLIGLSSSSGLPAIPIPAGDSATATQRASAVPQRAPASRRRFAVLGAAAAALVGILYFQRQAETPELVAPDERPRIERPRIVILPFENLGSPDDDYFAAGMTEEITSRLAAVSGQVFEGKYQEAVDRLSVIPEESFLLTPRLFPKTLLAGWSYDLLGEKDMARKEFDAARIFLEEKTRKEPQNFTFHSSLGLAYAGLGRKADAVREGQRAIELYPVSRDAFWGPYLVEDLARIYTMVGEHDAAVDRLEYLLSIPATISVPWLRLDPRWAPLRQNPRFQELLEKRE